tara:strand:+ start:1724 stop:2365 length:642 start_codon:yes stop_codon:yes gene_type:complete
MSLIEEYIRDRIQEGRLKVAGSEGRMSYYKSVNKKKDKKKPDVTSNRAMKQGGVRLLKDLQSKGGSRKERKLKEKERKERDVFDFEEQKIKDLSSLRQLRKDYDSKESMVLQEKTKRLRDIDDLMLRDKWFIEMTTQTYEDSDKQKMKELLLIEKKDLEQFKKKMNLLKKQIATMDEKNKKIYTPSYNKMKISFDTRLAKYQEDLKSYKEIYN